MKENNFKASYSLSFVLILAYIFTVNIGLEKLDLWGATKYYHNWVEDISNLNTSLSSLVKSYQLSISKISAPEPISGIFIYFLTRLPISNFYIFHLCNILFLILMSNFIYVTRKNTIIYLLLIISLITGYYEYVLLHMTHRFKIAIIFFAISIYIVNKKKRISEMFLILSLLTHFSMILVLPILLMLKKIGIKKIPNFSFRIMSIFSIILISSFILIIPKTDYDFILFTFLTKFNQSFIGSTTSLAVNNFINSIDRNLILTTLILSLTFIFLLFKVTRIKKVTFKLETWLFLIFTFIISTLIIIGSSRLLMVYYNVLFIIYIANYLYLSKSYNRAFLLFLSPLFIYNLYHGFSKGPFSIVYNQIFNLI